MKLSVEIFEFLTTPAHLWFWCCARLCGGKFECGIVRDSVEPYFTSSTSFTCPSRPFDEGKEWLRDMKNLPRRLAIFEFLATPAYLWRHGCSWLCGFRIGN